MRRPDARPPALMAMMPPASSPLIAMMPRADPALMATMPIALNTPTATMPIALKHTDGDDADRNQRTQRESPNRYHVPERERGPLGLDSPHVDHAEYAEQREDHGGEHGKCRQNPGYSLEDLSNVLRVLLHGGTSCGYAAYSSTPGPSTTGVPSVSLAELTTWRRTL